MNKNFHLDLFGEFVLLLEVEVHEFVTLLDAMVVSAVYIWSIFISLWSENVISRVLLSTVVRDKGGPGVKGELESLSCVC